MATYSELLADAAIKGASLKELRGIARRLARENQELTRRVSGFVSDKQIMDVRDARLTSILRDLLAGYEVRPDGWARGPVIPAEDLEGYKREAGYKSAEAAA